MNSIRDQVVEVCRSLFDRGLTPGTTGNVSVRVGLKLLITPTGRCMGRITSSDLVEVAVSGDHESGPEPSKELHLHLAVYRQKPTTSAVVHLHSPYATAVSCLAGFDPDKALGGLTGYHAVKVGRLGFVPYHPPGSAELAASLETHLPQADAVLLANHGSLVGSHDLETAADVAEQIEQSAQIFLLLGNRETTSVLGPRRPQ